MIQARDFLAASTASGISFFTGTPCSYLKPFINAVINDRALLFRDATNEGDAVAMAAGAFVGTGKPGLVMFQNSGLGNAVNALSSLNHPFRIPCLLVITHRGKPGGAPDEPQHELMGRITGAMLDTLGIPWEEFPTETAAISGVLGRAMAHFSKHSLPYALIMAAGSVAENELAAPPQEPALGERSYAFTETLTSRTAGRPSREEALRALLAARAPEDLTIATTGYTGRELYTLGDAPSHLYMVGSMGSASAFGLGLALTRPERRVWIVDGDGAALMRMGNLASIGAFKPAGLHHLIFDNGVHDSTGGQATVSGNLSFGAIAQACGYVRAAGADTLEGLKAHLAGVSQTPGPSLLHLRTRPGTLPKLGRPGITPAQVKDRLMRFLGASR